MQHLFEKWFFNQLRGGRQTRLQHLQVDVQPEQQRGAVVRGFAARPLPAAPHAHGQKRRSVNQRRALAPAAEASRRRALAGAAAAELPARWGSTCPAASARQSF